MAFHRYALLVAGALALFPSYGGARPTTAAQTYIAFGDSLTEDRGGSSYLAQLGQMRPRSTMINAGISAQGTPQIVARQGGRPAMLTVDGSMIPSSGSVAVTAISPPLLTNNAYHVNASLTGTLAGVAGTLTKAPGDTYSFARAAAGAPVPCPAATPFVPDLGVQATRATWIIWTGRNDVPANYASVTQGGIAAAVAYDHRPAKRFLVLGITTISDGTEDRGTKQYDRIVAHNAALAHAYGALRFGPGGSVSGRGGFLDVRRYLIEYGLTAAGIAPTDVDRRDIAADVIPSSLMRSDKKHLTDTGYGVIARMLDAALRARHW
jgi:hypothetical protein